MKYFPNNEMIGTGGFDIARVMTMMGVEGGSNFERQFYRSGGYVHEVIMRVCTGVVDLALREEMIPTIGETLEQKIESVEMENLKHKNISNDLRSIDNSIASITLDVAYEMGWQKQAGGRVYDSLSGHGFFIR